MKIKPISIFIFFLLLCTNILAQVKPLGLGLQIFTNIEQLVYCVPLPLKEFKELSGSERASHSFIHKKNKKVTINIRGFYSDSISIEDYYNKSYTTQDEEQGKIITQKEVLKNKKCFYAIGYYNNFINQYEFIEVTWVKSNEIVKLEIQYQAKDKKLWYDRLKIIIKNAYCR